jgi:hypothetical protein
VRIIFDSPTYIYSCWQQQCVVTVVGFDCLVISTQAGLCTRSHIVKFVSESLSLSHTHTHTHTHTRAHALSLPPLFLSLSLSLSLSLCTYAHMMSLFSKTYNQFWDIVISRRRFVLASLTFTGRCQAFFLPWSNSQRWPGPPHCWGFMITHN